MGCLKRGLKKIGIKHEGWVETDQKSAGWFEQLENIRDILLKCGGGGVTWRRAKIPPREGGKQDGGIVDTATRSGGGGGGRGGCEGCLSSGCRRRG